MRRFSLSPLWKKAIILVAIIMTVSIASAMLVQTWTGTLTWTINPAHISIYLVATGGSALPQPYTFDLGNITYENTTITSYWIQNDGGYNLTITTANVMYTPPSINYTATWTNTTFLLLTGAPRFCDTLNLTIYGSGSYTWNFEATPLT